MMPTADSSPQRYTSVILRCPDSLVAWFEAHSAPASVESAMLTVLLAWHALADPGQASSTPERMILAPPWPYAEDRNPLPPPQASPPPPMPRPRGRRHRAGRRGGA